MTEPGYPIHESLYHLTPDGSPRLVGGRCRECGENHFPPVSSCPYCSSDEVDEVELSERGTLWSFTSVLRPPPGYRGSVPYGFGVVELPEGLRVVTRLTEARLDRLAIGDEMQLVLDELHTDENDRVVQTYAFAPADRHATGGDEDEAGDEDESRAGDEQGDRRA